MFIQSLLKKKQPTHKSFVKHWLQGFSRDLGRKISGWGCGSTLLCLGTEIVYDLGKAQTDDRSSPTPSLSWKWGEHYHNLVRVFPPLYNGSCLLFCPASCTEGPSMQMDRNDIEFIILCECGHGIKHTWTSKIFWSLDQASVTSSTESHLFTKIVNIFTPLREVQCWNCNLILSRILTWQLPYIFVFSLCWDALILCDEFHMSVSK